MNYPPLSLDEYCDEIYWIEDEIERFASILKYLYKEQDDTTHCEELEWEIDAVEVTLITFQHDLRDLISEKDRHYFVR